MSDESGPANLDIVARLAEVAKLSEGSLPATAALLREAAGTIHTLRVLARIRDDINLLDREPEGSA